MMAYRSLGTTAALSVFSSGGAFGFCFAIAFSFASNAPSDSSQSSSRAARRNFSARAIFFSPIILSIVVA